MRICLTLLPKIIHRLPRGVINYDMETRSTQSPDTTRYNYTIAVGMWPTHVIIIMIAQQLFYQQVNIKEL